MNVKPIRFSGPEIRALLGGRKTQTRRLLKPQPSISTDAAGRVAWVHGTRIGFGRSELAFANHAVDRARYQPGDLLWVREAFAITRTTLDYETGGEQSDYEWAESDFGPAQEFLNGDARGGLCASVYFSADGEDAHPSELLPCIGLNGELLHPAEILWRPSIHMPRWASRLTLEVTDVRVQRLREISEEGAIAEGVTRVRDGCHVIKGFDYDLAGLCHTNAVTPFAKLWDSLNEKRGFGWDVNPWVAAVSFTVHKQNVDVLCKEREAA